MTTPNETQQQDIPIIPPLALLGIGFVGIAVAIIAFAAGAQGVVTVGALAIGLISLIAWIIMNPDDALNLVRGRNITYGGTALVIVALVIGAAIAIYAVVAAQGISVDVADSGVYSLNENVAELLEQLAADPTTPPVRIISFLSVAQSAERDRLTVLLDDFERISDGKITYEFVDPNRSPNVLEAYGANTGQIAVAPYDPETDTTDTDNAEVVAGNPQTGNFADQRLITDAIITVTASGDFRAYFLQIADSVAIDDNGPNGGQVFVQQLRDRFRWTVEEISPLALRPTEDDGLAIDTDAETNDIELNDPAADGEVLIIAGGQEALPDEVAQGVIDYLEAGGNVILMGSQSVVPGGITPGAAENLAAYLTETFGITMNNDLIIDPASLQQTGSLQVIVSNYGSHPIVEAFTDRDFMLMNAPHSLTLGTADNVTITALVETSAEAYAKADLDLTQPLTQEDVLPTDDDPNGPFVIAAAAENSETGARLVVFGSADPLYNEYVQYLSAGAVNFLAGQEAVFWATDYDSVAGALADLPPIENPADAPIFIAQAGTTTTINLIVLGLLPFGILAAGIAVWWARREGPRT